MDWHFYIKLFFRRFHYFLIATVLCGATGIYVARIQPPTYQAEARLLVENEQIPGDLAASTVQVNPNAQLQIIQQRILTRDILIDMANRLDIYADARRAGEPRLQGDEIVRDLRNRLRINVSGSSRQGSEQATIVRISFTAPNGQLAANVTNEVVTLIQGEDVSMRTRSARETLAFFEQRVEELDRQLSESSARILTFQEANIASLPDSLEFRRNQQATAQERILVIERQITELRNRRDRLADLMARGVGGGLADPTQAGTPEMQRLRTLTEQRDQLLAILSPENPRVQVLDRQIDALEASMSRNALTSEGGQDTPLEDTPTLSPIEIQLLDLNGQIDFLNEQRGQISEELAVISSSIAETPGNAITLAALERNYASIERQYNEAIAARAKAQTGDTIEGLGRGQRISIIETAVAPREPNSPNRRRIAAAGLGGGMMLGLVLIVALEFLRGGIRRPVDLTRGLGIAAFATLPYLRTRREILRRRAFVWGGVIVILSTAAVAVWAVDTFYMPLDEVIERIQQRLR
jgi:uncharacterized protein involved in exopolysaccharide biosynthesis